MPGHTCMSHLFWWVLFIWFYLFIWFCCHPYGMRYVRLCILYIFYFECIQDMKAWKMSDFWSYVILYVLKLCYLKPVILTKEITSKSYLTNTCLKSNPFCLKNRWKKPLIAWKFSASLGHTLKGGDLSFLKCDHSLTQTERILQRRTCVWHSLLASELSWSFSTWSMEESKPEEWRMCNKGAQCKCLWKKTVGISQQRFFFVKITYPWVFNICLSGYYYLLIVLWWLGSSANSFPL